MYNRVMHPRLYKMLLEVDKRFDYSTDGYFSWSEEHKQALVGDILDFFHPYIINGNIPLENVINGFTASRDQAIHQEEYEQADILQRCLDVFNEV